MHLLILQDAECWWCWEIIYDFMIKTTAIEIEFVFECRVCTDFSFIMSSALVSEFCNPVMLTSNSFKHSLTSITLWKLTIDKDRHSANSSHETSIPRGIWVHSVYILQNLQGFVLNLQFWHIKIIYLVGILQLYTSIQNDLRDR